MNLEKKNLSRKLGADISQTIPQTKPEVISRLLSCLVLLFFGDLKGINMAPGSATIPWDLAYLKGKCSNLE